VNQMLIYQGAKFDRPTTQLCDCMPEYYVITSNSNQAVTYVELTEFAAMDASVTDPTLQTMEMHSTAPHNAKGHFYYHTFSAAAATKLRTCKYVEIKVPGEFHIRLTPATGTANTDPTWQHAVVSGPLHVQTTLHGQKCCFSTSLFWSKQPRSMARFSESQKTLSCTFMTARDMC